MEELLQIHLASKVDLPAVVDDKGKEKVKARAGVPVPGMSNRAVRYRLLDVDKLQAIAKDAATLAGEDATGAEVYSLTRMHCLYAMVAYVSPPTDDPLALDEKLWTKCSSTNFMIPGEWSKLFKPKDTQVLLGEYRKWHEMPNDQMDVLSGKAIPVASAG